MEEIANENRGGADIVRAQSNACTLHDVSTSKIKSIGIRPLDIVKANGYLTKIPCLDGTAA